MDRLSRHKSSKLSSQGVSGGAVAVVNPPPVNNQRLPYGYQFNSQFNKS